MDNKLGIHKYDERFLFARLIMVWMENTCTEIVRYVQTENRSTSVGRLK